MSSGYKTPKMSENPQPNFVTISIHFFGRNTYYTPLDNPFGV